MVSGTGKPSYVSVNRGLALLDEAIEQIEFQAKRGENSQWHQGSYRCGSGMCLAGWTAQLAGGQWAFPADNDFSEYMMANDDDAAAACDNLDGKHVVFVSNRAQELLGLDDYQAEELFSGFNDLGDIKRLRNEFAETMSD